MSKSNICDFLNSHKNLLISVGTLFRNSEIPQWNEEVLQDIKSNPKKWLGIRGYSIVESSQIISAILARSNEDFTEILALATHPSYKNQGYASKILTYLINLRATPFLLEVSVKNTSALNLYTKNGFTSLSLRKNYYTMPDHSLQDAVVMKRDFAR